MNQGKWTLTFLELQIKPSSESNRLINIFKSQYHLGLTKLFQKKGPCASVANYPLWLAFTNSSTFPGFLSSCALWFEGFRISLKKTEFIHKNTHSLHTSTHWLKQSKANHSYWLVNYFIENSHYSIRPIKYFIMYKWSR